jgi:hypothetical protein
LTCSYNGTGSGPKAADSVLTGGMRPLFYP